MSSLLLFRLSGRRFALPTSALIAVTESLHIAPIPHRAGTALLGLVAFGGEVLPCFSLPQLLSLDGAMGAGGKTLILEEAPGRNWAVPVDEVEGMRPAFDAAGAEELDAETLFRQMRLAVA
jgi:chemotaxis-related protein WspD